MTDESLMLDIDIIEKKHEEELREKDRVHEKELQDKDREVEELKRLLGKKSGIN